MLIAILVIMILLLAFGLVGDVVGLVWALIVGALIGWIASLIMKTDDQQGALLNVLVGVAGSLLGKWFFGDLLGLGGAAAAGAFSVVGLIFGIAGAVILIAILKLLNLLK